MKSGNLNFLEPSGLLQACNGTALPLPCLLIDIAIPNDSKINTTETENLSNKKNLEIEDSRVWKVRTVMVPVMIGALGTIKKELDQNLQLLPGHPSVTELQITLMSPAHIIHKVLG